MMNTGFVILKCCTLIALFAVIHSFYLLQNTNSLEKNNIQDKDLFNSPPEISQNQKLYCGYSHTLAIKPDSTLWVCGNNSQGQLGNGNTVQIWSPMFVNGMTAITDAAGGYEHSIALKN